MSGRVLVTGNSGFIGRHLAPYLAAHGYDVVGLDRRSWILDPPVPQITCDILDATRLKAALAEVRPSIVVHLAARTDLDENRDLAGYAANFQGTKNLIDAIADVGTIRRAIYTSSQLVCRYGYQPLHDQDYQPSSLYGESKVAMEKIVRARDGGGVDWCLVRPTTVWGPGMSPHYRRFLRLLRKGRYFHVGGSALLKSYSYIGNIVHQYRRLLEVPAPQIQGKTFYLSDYEMLSTRWYADELARLLGGPRVRTYPAWFAALLARGGDVMNRLGFRSFPFNTFRLRNILTEARFDLTPTRAVLGDVPVAPSEGVKKTAEWFLAFERGEREARRLGGAAEGEGVA